MSVSLHAQDTGADAYVALFDVEVRDQDNVLRRFIKDVLGDRIVAVNFMFTTCTTLCPAQSRLLSQLQSVLGDHLDVDMRLVSVSIDPATDTPSRLKRYASEHGAKAGWRWLTGSKANIERIAAGFDALSGDITEHPAVIFVGDPLAGEWTRFDGSPKPQALARRMYELAAARAAARRN